ncbi:hypothetical protein HPB50_001938 [Hyalomma asiaticum]|uniref:Uncharacterized protein n=1 Tax=Hyalomma asiaticum TaxID=266040 RepID=A0ACB7TFG8_HYAAI|nr:hypothetical protein HPB50_001938 [Hyalomma asiaticum]
MEARASCSAAGGSSSDSSDVDYSPSAKSEYDSLDFSLSDEDFLTSSDSDHDQRATPEKRRWQDDADWIKEFATSVLASLSRELTAEDLVSLLGGNHPGRLNQLQGVLQLAVVQHLTPGAVSDLLQLVAPARDALLARWAAPLIQDMQKFITLKDKATIITEVEKGRQKMDIADKFGIACSSLSTIIKNKASILGALQNSESAKNKTVTAAVFLDVDKEVFAWFCEQCTNSVPLSGRILQQKALDVACMLDHNNFKASPGWLSRFKAHHDIVAKVTSGEAAAVDSVTTSKDHPDIDELSRKTGFDQLAFRIELVNQILGTDQRHVSPSTTAKEVAPQAQSPKKRQNCKLCYEKQKIEMKTPVLCEPCGVYLCFIPARDCFKEWHETHPH